RPRRTPRDPARQRRRGGGLQEPRAARRPAPAPRRLARADPRGPGRRDPDSAPGRLPCETPSFAQPRRSAGASEPHRERRSAAPDRPGRPRPREGDLMSSSAPSALLRHADEDRIHTAEVGGGGPWSRGSSGVEGRATTILSHGTVPRISLAEDDPSVRRVVASILRAESYEVVEALDGEELIERIESLFTPGAPRRAPQSLVLSDVRMPGF